MRHKDIQIEEGHKTTTNPKENNETEKVLRRKWAKKEQKGHIHARKKKRKEVVLFDELRNYRLVLRC